MSAFQELIDQDSVYADLVMQAAETPGPIVVFEGQYDYKIIGRHFNKNSVPLYAGGKATIKKCVNNITKFNKKILFIADRDFDTEISLITHPDIIYTVKHDFLVDIISENTHILENVALDYCPLPDVFKPQAHSVDQIVKNALNYAHTIAKVRKAIHAGLLPSINLKKFNFQGTPLNPSDQDIFDLVSKRSKNTVPVNMIQHAVAMVDSSYDSENFGMIGDHDLIASLRKSLIDQGVDPKNDNELGYKIISRIHCSLLANDTTFSNIRRWCQTNYSTNPFKCEIIN